MRLDTSHRARRTPEGFESKLQRTFGSVREKVAGRERILHVELRKLYCSPDMIRMIELRAMRRAGYLVRRGDMSNSYKILIVNSEDVGVDGTIIIE
jgi:hypothetical protein